MRLIKKTMAKIRTTHYQRVLSEAVKTDEIKSPTRFSCFEYNFAPRIAYTLFDEVIKGESEWKHRRLPLQPIKGETLHQYANNVTNYIQAIGNYLSFTKGLTRENGFDLQHNFYSCEPLSLTELCPNNIFDAKIGLARETGIKSDEEVRQFVRMIKGNEGQLAQFLEAVKCAGQKLPEDMYNRYV